MHNVIIFEPGTGKIICVGSIKEWETPASNELLYSNPPSDIGGTHYVVNGVVTLMPAMPITVSGLILSNVPTGTNLWIGESVYPCSGTVELSFEFPGTYSIRLEKFPYLDFKQEFTV